MQVNSLELRFEELETNLAALKDEMSAVVTATQKKKFDMPVCIESGIDCEFFYEDIWYVDKLKAISEDKGGNFCLAVTSDEKYFDCRPRMNHIHASPTGWDKCPIPEGFVINFWINKYNQYNNKTDYLENAWLDIIMFEITGKVEGYE